MVVVELGRGGAGTRGKGERDVEVWVRGSNFFCWKAGGTIRRCRYFEFAGHVVAVEQELRWGGEREIVWAYGIAQTQMCEKHGWRVWRGGAREGTCTCGCLSISIPLKRTIKREQRVKAHARTGGGAGAGGAGREEDELEVRVCDYVCVFETLQILFLHFSVVSQNSISSCFIYIYSERCERDEREREREREKERESSKLIKPRSILK